MKRRNISLLLLALLLNCRPSADLEGFSKSRLYHFAAELSKKLPALDPEKNRTLAQCRYFNVTCDSFLLEQIKESGENIYDWLALDSVQLKNIVQQHLKRMIERRLLLISAQAAGVVASPAERDTALQRLYRQNGGEPLYRKRLLADGLIHEQVVQRLCEQVTLRKFLSAIENQPVHVTEAELIDLYHQDKSADFRQIIVHRINTASNEIKLEELVSRINNDEDFGELAKQYSDDPHTSGGGGLIENVARGRLPAVLEACVFSASVGHVRRLEYDQADYFIKVVRRYKETRPFTAVRAELQEKCVQQKKQQRIALLKDSLWRQALITIIL